MKINVLTLFPEVFEPFFNYSIIKRAREKQLVDIDLFNFRDFTTDKHKRVDDTSYGGGAGMVLQVEPIDKCLKAIKNKGHVVALTPTGSKLSDKKVNQLLENESLTIVCGHYEGFDERVFNYIDEEISIGDYVLSGGESAAMVLVDALTRKVEGVINKESVDNDSFSRGILDFPVYTKPYCYDNMCVPDILLSGDHEKIAMYRYKEALKKTYLRRPDLIDTSNVDAQVLAEIIEESDEK